jgi:hypothetical protein
MNEQKRKNPAAVALGRLGGRVGGLATGPSKARTPEQARAAVNVRWAKYRAAAKAKQSVNGMK